MNKPYFEFGWYGFSEFFEVSGITLKYYFQFLYAGHNFNFMSQYEPYGWGYLIDFVGRIFIGYGYYQVIQPMRKYKMW